MPLLKIRTAVLLGAVGLSLTACNTYGYNSYGYDGYGYGSGLSVGYANSPYWGWNDGFYYPGTGYYVYDSYRRPHAWNQRQQGYWTNRQSGWRDRGQLRENWNGFRRHGRR